MKKFALLFLIFSNHVTARIEFGVVTAEDATIQLLSLLSTINDQENTYYCSQKNQSAIEIINCPEELAAEIRLGIGTALNLSLLQLDGLQAMQSDSNLSSEKSFFVERVEDRFKCISDRLFAPTIVCTNGASCEGSTYAYTRSTYAYVPSGQSPDESVYLCTEGLGEDKLRDWQDLPGTFIHEVSHLCGTEDLAYFMSSWRKNNPNRDLRLPRDVGTFTWQNHVDNADSYTYWANFGFIFPKE